jgi:hypothetical protein
MTETLESGLIAAVIIVFMAVLLGERCSDPTLLSAGDAAHDAR